MNTFLSPEALRLKPYTPGEQPRDQQYIKLNTNESPFPPSPKVLEVVDTAQVGMLNLYSDPTCKVLEDAIAAFYGIEPENVMSGNGSDEVLAFAFRACAGEGKPIAYADITYGCYKTWAALFGLESKVIPLREDFSVSVEDYMDFPGTIVIANPNAPTGMLLPESDIRRLLAADRERVVIIDEAYAHFGAESLVPLTKEYDNLLVVQTMSKNRNLAGARIGYAMGSAALISAVNRVKYSFNPYNVNRLSLLAGAAALEDKAYFEQCCSQIVENRGWVTAELRALGFTVLDSYSNFIFAASDTIPGQELYLKLKDRGILVRWFDADRIRPFVRITIGSRKQLTALVNTIKELLEEAKA
ncbi:MAG: histidinol-phosphate transaminase [Oscillibacter sp.]|nr:histidinol-phosphate transaminase [Oscillibacter sp.]